VRRNKWIGGFFLSISLFSMILAASLLLAMIIAAVISLALRTDSPWVYNWIGFPLTFVFAAYWILTRWTYVKSYISGNGGM
jgi:hypothetical protein